MIDVLADGAVVGRIFKAIQINYAPIVLKRVADKIPQLGFIRADAPDYEAYRQELETVTPAFGFFASPRSRLVTTSEEARLSLASQKT
jgi:hypothetical protein